MGVCVVLAKIIDIDTNKKGCYVSCVKCLKKVVQNTFVKTVIH